MYRNLFSTTLPLSLAVMMAACSAPSPGPLSDALPADSGQEQGPGHEVYYLDVSPELPPPTAVRPGPPSPVPLLPVVLYLNLEGAVITRKPGVSDAAKDTSPLCGGTFPGFDHKPYGADRAKVTAQVKAGVAALLASFDITLVTTRPAAAPYEMVVVGGLPTLCGYSAGIGGLAPLDCHNKNRGDVSFVFSDGITQLDMLAIAIAHELGHTFGLPHSSEACDVMSPMYCPGLKKTFLDKKMQIWPDHKGKCGLTYTNSWQMMYDVLGQAPGKGL